MPGLVQLARFGSTRPVDPTARNMESEWQVLPLHESVLHLDAEEFERAAEKLIDVEIDSLLARLVGVKDGKVGRVVQVTVPFFDLVDAADYGIVAVTPEPGIVSGRISPLADAGKHQGHHLPGFPSRFELLDVEGGPPSLSCSPALELLVNQADPSVALRPQFRPGQPEILVKVELDCMKVTVKVFRAEGDDLKALAWQINLTGLDSDRGGGDQHSGDPAVVELAKYRASLRPTVAEPVSLNDDPTDVSQGG